MRLPPYVKSTVRRATRALGYELVPFDAGLAFVQRALLTNGGIDLVIDAGANVGQYGERVRALGFRGKIISFEPSLAAFQSLSKRSASDELWTAHRLALDSASGSRELNISENSVSSSLLIVRPEHLRAAPEARITRAELVPVSTLDLELRSELFERAWLKLDVQGHEAEVLKGGSITLSNVLVIQCEMSFEQLYDEQTSWLTLATELDAAGFRLCYLDPGFQEKKTGYLQQADAVFVRR